MKTEEQYHWYRVSTISTGLVIGCATALNRDHAKELVFMRLGNMNRHVESCLSELFTVHEFNPYDDIVSYLHFQPNKSATIEKISINVGVPPEQVKAAYGNGVIKKITGGYSDFYGLLETKSRKGER